PGMTALKMEEDILTYTVLVYEEPGCGIWVKIPEFDQQCLTDDWEFCLGQLEEILFYELRERRRQGELIPEKIKRTVRHVDKEVYGPTQVEIDEARYLAELADEYADEEEEPSPGG